MEAEYIALALVNLIYAYSPRRIILGGGVPQHQGLIQMAREKVKEIINGYVQSAELGQKIEEYIQSPFLGNRSSALGAVAMAIQLLQKSDE